MTKFDETLSEAFYKAVQGTVDEVEALRQRLIDNGASPNVKNKDAKDEAVHCLGNILQGLGYAGFGNFGVIILQLEETLDLRLVPNDRKLPAEFRTAGVVKKLKKEVDAFASALPKPSAP